MLKRKKSVLQKNLLWIATGILMPLCEGAAHEKLYPISAHWLFRGVALPRAREMMHIAENKMATSLRALWWLNTRPTEQWHPSSAPRMWSCYYRIIQSRCSITLRSCQLLSHCFSRTFFPRHHVILFSSQIFSFNLHKHTHTRTHTLLFLFSI